MDKIAELNEKKRRIEAEAREILEGEKYTAQDNEKADKLLADLKNVESQVRKLEDLEGKEANEVKNEMNMKTPEAREWSNHDGTNKAKVYKRGVNFYVPDKKFDVSLGRFLQISVMGAKTEAERRALSEGSDGAGGYTVPSYLMPAFYDKLRAKNRVLQAGAQIVDLKSDSNKIAKLASDCSLYWRGENVEITASDPTFEAVEFNPKTCAALTKASRELLFDSLNVKEMIEDSFIQSFANELDRVALIGTSGSGEPDGVLNFSGLSLAYGMGTSGSSFYTGPGAGATSAGSSPYYPFLAVISEIMQNNGNVTGAIMNPRELVDLADLIDSTSQPLQMPELLKNIPLYDTTAVPVNDTVGSSTNASKIYIGDWTKLLVGVRNGLTFQVLTDRYAEFYQYGFLAAMRMDVQATHEANFGYIAGITPRSGAIT